MPATAESPAQQRIRIAREERRARLTGDDSTVRDARRNYATTKLEDYITKVLAEAPPLTPAQRARLRDVLAGGGDLDGAA